MIYAQMNQQRNWDNVIFSGEKTLKSGHFSVGIWGWVSRDGAGEMTFVDRCMDSEEYCEVLDQVLIPSVEIVYGNMQNVVFMQVILSQ